MLQEKVKGNPVVFVPSFYSKYKDKAFFVYGFAKNEKSNIENNDLLDFRRLAADMLSYAELEIAKAVKDKLLIEVEYENKTISQ